MQVKDRTFLITGAASGLGAATAERLVNAGANVVLCDMSDRVLNLAEQLLSLIHISEPTRPY